MIAKLAEAPAGRGFGELSEYVCTAPSGSRPHRILSVTLRGFGPEEADGLPGETWRLAADAVDLHHSCRPDARRLTGHLIVSFTREETERLDPRDYSRIELSLLQSIGCGDNRRISAMHGDTLHRHAHVVFDRINPDGRLQERRLDYLRLGERRIALCREFGLEVRPLRRGRSAERYAVAVHEDLESYAGWLRREVAPGLRRTLSAPDTGWEAVQEFLQRHGSELRRQGGGLVFTHLDLGIKVRASSVSRAFTWSRLNGILGEFREAGSATPVTSYRPRSLLSPRLHRRFVRHRTERRERNASERHRIRSTHRQVARAIAREEQEMVRALRHASTPEQRRALRASLHQARPDWRRRLERNRVACRRRLAAFRSTVAPLTWTGFLFDLARQGEIEAIETLRRRSTASPSANEDCLEAIRDWKCLGIRLPGLSCEVHPDGTLDYSGPGDVRLLDRGARLVPANHQPATLHTALRLAAGKFGSRVRGTPGFRRSLRQALGDFDVELHLVSGSDRER